VNPLTRSPIFTVTNPASGATIANTNGRVITTNEIRPES
jgi:hypothetical protein